MKKINIKKIGIALVGIFSAINAPQISAGGATPDVNIPRPQSAPLPAPRPAEIKQEEKPAIQQSATEATVKLTVETFNFSGNDSFSNAQLNALIKDYQNRQVGFKELNEAVRKVTEFYRNNGYFLAQAYLPAQDIKEGKVEIAVIEGKLGQLSLSGAETLNVDFITKMADYRLSPNSTVSEHNLVRNVTLLNALPGTRATAQLNPSDAVGATDIEISMEPLPRLQGYIGANTFGNPFTGREVAVAGARFNNPAGLGDQLSLDLKRSNDNGQRGLNLGYISPIHASGTLFSASYNYIDYKLGSTFENLDASGDSQYFNLAIDQPIVRDAQKGLSAHFATSYKRMNDEVSVASLKNRRNILSAEIGLFGDWLNAAGNVSNQLSFTIRSGKVMFDDDFAQTIDETGARTKGGFVKYNLSATRIQYFANDVSIALRADYQRASKNLDIVEKISIGGINRWRQYAELPSLADTGFVVGAELRKKIPANEALAKIHLVDITPYAFIDFGRGKINQKPSSSDNHIKSIHGGLGLDANFKNDWIFSLSGSHQNRDFDGAGAENELRFWGQLIKYF